MNSIVELVTQQLGGNTLSALSKKLGADESTTSTAISEAVPLLMTALARNSAKPEGAQALPSSAKSFREAIYLRQNISPTASRA